jgi:ABC-type nitrate/sulfonate/bicarbonate transport system permease component
MPEIFDALRLCNGWAWTYLVVAELIAANEGLGYRVLKFYRFVQTPKIFVYLAVLGALGLALDFMFRKLERPDCFIGRTRPSDEARGPQHQQNVPRATWRDWCACPHFV